MKHRIKNFGPRHLEITTATGVKLIVYPGDDVTCEAVTIRHGDGSAHYTVEPAEPPTPTEGEKK